MAYACSKTVFIFNWTRLQRNNSIPYTDVLHIQYIYRWHLTWENLTESGLLCFYFLLHYYYVFIIQTFFVFVFIHFLLSLLRSLNFGWPEKSSINMFFFFFFSLSFFFSFSFLIIAYSLWYHLLKCELLLSVGNNLNGIKLKNTTKLAIIQIWR